YPILDLVGVGVNRIGMVEGRAQRGTSSANLDVVYDPGAPGSQQARIRAAEAQLDAVRAEREGLARDIARALADLRSDQRAGAARVAAAREAVTANRATVDASREEFSIGRRSLLGLLDAQRDLFEANETLIAAEREVALSGYAALALTGDILDAFAISLPSPTDDAPVPAITGDGA
ncbi:MAG: TolC family protein, partial [Roseinatronobacter sp.]